MTLKHLLAAVLSGILIGCTSTPKQTVPIEPQSHSFGTSTPKQAVPIEPQSHSFGIYLVASPPQRPWEAAELGDLADLKLVKEPVISDTDILSYDWSDHSMLVKQEALSRLPSPPAYHQPFVLMADGERIYLGAFAVGVSSFSCSVPTIIADFRTFTNQLIIERGYPGPDFGTGPDPRSDNRIRTALACLRKLK